MLPLALPTPPETLVILLIFFILLGIPAGVVYLLRKRKHRVEELETRVDELEGERTRQD